ncbi:hypothetical protein [Paenibacillus amylolyticus]|uniref:hypothetical protein n=1 Tax=Paenibacillus amylolyticus TaxID=1451 RepID=UPI003D98BAA4
MPAELTEFRVVTAAGRIFGWNAFDYEDLFRSMQARGHTPVYAKPLSEYEAEIANREEQERLHHELQQAIEEERKTA